jgi:hypothetical protein
MRVAASSMARGSHLKGLLAPQRQHHAGGDQHLQLGSRGEELLQQRCRLRHLLEVVDHQQELLVAQALLHRLQDGASARLGDGKGPGHRRGDQGGIGHRRQVREEGAILERGEELGRDLEGQAGLAGATRAGQGEQPGLLQQRPDLGDLLLPADEGGELHREVAGPGVQRPRRREVGREALDQQLVQVLGHGDVLQPVVAQVAEGGPLRQGLLHQPPGGLGDQDLPAVAGSSDPGGPVHVHADVVVSAQDALAGVQAHPHPYPGGGGPLVGGEAALGVDRGPDRPHRAGERHEEGIALGADLHAAARLDGLAHDRRVLVPDRGVPIAQLLQQPRGTLDVGEQEGDGSGRQRRQGRPARPRTGRPGGSSSGHLRR